MFCPRCQGVELTPISYKGITIDKCPRCEGVWLDKGEEAFVTQVLAHAKNAACEKCAYFNKNKGMCTRLKIYVKRNFSCANFIGN